MSARGRSEGNEISHYFLYFANILVWVLWVAILARALISWFPMAPGSPIVRILNEITEPVLAPLRRVVPRLGMVDITPMVAMLVLFFIQLFIQKAIASA
ncbi:MAG TPA: YggT family protein [Dehalococcoidia bacterium]|jgi:YggT family protein